MDVNVNIKRIKSKCKIEVEVQFEAYQTKALNKKAHQAIKKYLKDLIKDQSFISVYIDQDEDGSAIESCFEITKVNYVNKR